MMGAHMTRILQHDTDTSPGLRLSGGPGAGLAPRSSFQEAEKLRSDIRALYGEISPAAIPPIKVLLEASADDCTALGKLRDAVRAHDRPSLFFPSMNAFVETPALTPAAVRDFFDFVLKLDLIVTTNGGFENNPKVSPMGIMAASLLSKLSFKPSWFADREFNRFYQAMGRVAAHSGAQFDSEFRVMTLMLADRATTPSDFSRFDEVLAAAPKVRQPALLGAVAAQSSFKLASLKEPAFLSALDRLADFSDMIERAQRQQAPGGAPALYLQYGFPARIFMEYLGEGKKPAESAELSMERVRQWRDALDELAAINGKNLSVRTLPAAGPVVADTVVVRQGEGVIARGLETGRALYSSVAGNCVLAAVHAPGICGLAHIDIEMSDESIERFFQKTGRHDLQISLVSGSLAVAPRVFAIAKRYGSVRADCDFNGDRLDGLSMDGDGRLAAVLSAGSSEVWSAIIRDRARARSGVRSIELREMQGKKGS